MKKTAVFVFLSFLLAVPASAKDRQFSGSGEAVSVDPAYNRITIKHKAIKGFGSGQNDFAADAKTLQGVAQGDLVDFSFAEEGGVLRLDKIVSTGRVQKEEDLRLTQVVQGALEGTGEVAKAVTSPIAPVHDGVAAAAGATTDTTGAVLENDRNKF